MAKIFDYKVQANGSAYNEITHATADIHNSWAVFHKNPDDKGRWVLDPTTGYLRIDSNQNGLSGRYDTAKLNAKDYRIETEAIVSSTDDDNWGLLFRYQDNFHFYFVGWDGGGEYGWGNQTLRLYKVVGDEYRLLQSVDIGHWTPGVTHTLNADIIGNTFTIKINGIERLKYTDNNAPYMQGAYGPCATSQIVSWKRFFVRGEFDFMVEDTFNGEMETSNHDQATATRISTDNVKDLLTPVVQAYLAAHGYTIATARINTYTLQSLYDGAEVFFNTSPMSRITTNGGLYPYAYMKYSDTPPVAPTNFKGAPDGLNILWSWKDNSVFEEGFEILDQNMRLLAVVGRDATEWEEGGLLQNTEYKRFLRSYNASGRSNPITAIARTEDLNIFYTPVAPINLRGMTNSTTKITWYWDEVPTADFYQIWDAVTDTLLLTTTTRKFVEENLDEDTMYQRYVTASNVAGRSSKSITATAFTDQTIVLGPVPSNPLFFEADVIDEGSIRWFWQAPHITIEPDTEDGTPKEQEQLDAELLAELEKIAYRVYDMNGEVLYESPVNVLEFTEVDLKPGTSYTHFVKAFNVDGESARSNYAYATTFVIDPEVEDLPEALPWPPETLECILPEDEPLDKMATFATAIGDNLDLKIRPHGTPPDYLVGNMNRTIPEDLDGDGEPDYGEGEGPGEGEAGGGMPGGGGAGAPQNGFGPGNPYGGGHSAIGGIGLNGGGIGGGIGGGVGGSGGSIGGGIGGGFGAGYGDWTEQGHPGYSYPNSGVCTPNSPREWFSYEVQLQATQYMDIDVYAKKNFRFRFKGEGVESAKQYVNDYIGRLWVFPLKDIEYKVTGEIDRPILFNYKMVAHAKVRTINAGEFQYSLRPYVDALFNLSLPMTIEDVFQGPDAHRWGPNTWTYNSAERMVVGDQNTGWSGFYNRALLNDTNYTVETEMGVSRGSGDDDFFGFAFRLQENSNGTKRFYYFGVDNGGTALGRRWGLYKTTGTSSVPSSDPRTTGFGYKLIDANMAGLPYTSGWEEDRWYKTRIVVDGPRIQIWLDNVQVVDYIDNDPMFDKGSWGPTNFSQQGASFKNIKYTTGTIRRIYAPSIVMDSIDKSHNMASNPKVITTTPLKDDLNTVLLNEFNAWKARPGNQSGTLQVYAYGAEPSDSQIINASNESGDEGIKVYTNFPDSFVYSYTDVQIDSAIYSYEITENYNSPSRLIIVCRRRYGSIPNCLCQGPMYTAEEEKAYKLANGIADADFQIVSYEPVSFDPEVHLVAPSATSTNNLHAWTSAKTIYRGEKIYSQPLHFDDTLSVGHTNDFASNDFYANTHQDLTQEIELRNANGDVYPATDDSDYVKYSIVPLNQTKYEEITLYRAEKDIAGNTFTRLPARSTIGILGVSKKTIGDGNVLVAGYRSLEKRSFDFNGTTTGPLQTYNKIEDLAFTGTPILPTDFPNAHLAAVVIGGDEGPWFAFGRDEYTRVNRTSTVPVLTDDRFDRLVIGTEGDSVNKPWTGTSEWYDGSVNGAEPIYQDGDGQKDLLAPIDLDVAANVTIDKWIVELSDPTGSVDVEVLNGTNNWTIQPNDTARFYSNTLSKKSIGRKWFGPTYVVEGYQMLCGGGYIEFVTKILSPANDPVLEPMRPLPPYVPPTGPSEPPEIVIGHFSVDEDPEAETTEMMFTAQAVNESVKWEAIITSRNPNVAIKVVSEPDYSNDPGIFLPLKVRAWIINPIQTPWNPLIHNGFYYLNQQEHFLYASQDVRGRYLQSEGFEPIEFPYSVKLYAERLVTDGIKAWTDTYRSDFKGSNSLVDLDSSLGNITLRKDGAARYYAQGTYTSETKTLKDIPAAWREITWNDTTPASTTIGIEVSTMDPVTSAWGAWMPVQKGDIIPAPLSDKIRYRATLTEGQERVIATESKIYDTQLDWAKGIHEQTVANAGIIQMTDHETDALGRWTSDILDLGTAVDSMGTVTFTPIGTNGTITIQTVSADTLNGPWDGTGQPFVELTGVVTNLDGTKTGQVMSPLKRYMMYRVTLRRGQAERERTVSLNTDKELAEGLSFTNISTANPVNVKIENGRIILSDITKDGLYYSAAIDMSGLIDYKTLEVVSLSPAGTSIKVQTLTAPTLLDLETVEGDDSYWKDLSPTGDIMSPNERFLKVRVQLKAFSSSSIATQVIHDATADFLPTETSNVDVINGAIVLKDARYLGYYVSGGVEFVDLDSWIDLKTTAALAGGNIIVYTATSPNQFGPWTPWELRGVDNRIVSPANRFIRYKIELSGTATPSTNSHLVNTVAKFQNGSTRLNLSILPSGTGFTQLDKSVEAVYISPVIQVKNLIAYTNLLYNVIASTGAEVVVRTQTSFDGVNWNEWKDIDATNAILSDDLSFIRYRVEIRPGYEVSASQKVIEHTTAAHFNSLSPTLTNTEVIAAGSVKNVSLIDALTKVLQVGNYYSGLIDFGGQVTGFNEIELDITMPSMNGGVKLYTVSADESINITEGQSLTVDALPWVEATFNSTTGKYTIASPVGRFIRYRLELTPGYEATHIESYLYNSATLWNTGTLTNLIASASGIKLVDATINGEYLSKPMNFATDYDLFASYENLTFDVTKTDVGGSVEVFLRAAATQAGLATATEVSMGNIPDGALVTPITAVNTNTYLQFRIVVKPGTLTDTTPSSPVVKSVQVNGRVRRAQSPLVNRVVIPTSALGFKAYATASVDGFQIHYQENLYTTPSIDKVAIAGRTIVKVGPEVDSIMIKATVNAWSTPKLDKVVLNPKTFKNVSRTPVLHDITFKAEMPSQIVPEEFEVPMTGKLKSDMQTYQLTDKTMKVIMDEYFAGYSISEANLTRLRYDLIPGLPDIDMDTRNSDPLLYLDGESEPFARTTVESFESTFSRARVTVDEKDQALISPVPQQGAPIIVKDASGNELTHVTFVDDNGNLSLTYKDCGCTDGTREFVLDHINYDPATLEIEVDADLTGVYTKLKEGDDYLLCGSVVTFREVYPEDMTVWYSYKIKHSFILDHNFDLEQGNALITMHKPILDSEREIFVTYETDEYTAYYRADEVDMNPMRSVLNEGFIYLTDEYFPTKKLEVRFNPNMLNANGMDMTTIQVFARDKNGNPVVGDKITITVSDGTIVMRTKETDFNGMVSASYKASTTPGEVIVTVEDTTARIEAQATIHLRSEKPQPRIEVELSDTELSPDGIEKVKITARVVDENQQQAISKAVLFEAIGGGVLDYTEDATNVKGEAHNYIKTTTVPGNKIIVIKATVPELGAVGFANILVKEVAPIV